MASHRSYYASSPTSSIPNSPVSSVPPPPPPKPLPRSSDTSRAGTPLPASSMTTPAPPIPPPPVMSTPPAPPPHLESSASTALHSGPTSQPPPMVQAQIAPPNIQDHWLPQGLADKSITDLQQLLASPQLFSALSQTHPSYASSNAPIWQLLQSNLELAKQMATLEAQLGQLRDQTAHLLLNHTSLQTQWRRKQAEMDEALSPWGPRSMYQRLISSISEQEALLRAMTDSFVEGTNAEEEHYGGSNGKAGEKEVTDWVKRIRDGTAVLEKRREMRARWDEGRVGGWR